MMMINYKQSSVCFGLSSEFFEFEQIISIKSRMPLLACVILMQNTCFW